MAIQRKKVLLNNVSKGIRNVYIFATVKWAEHTARMEERKKI